jgi:hypothetical protein
VETILLFHRQDSFFQVVRYLQTLPSPISYCSSATFQIRLATYKPPGCGFAV